MCLSPLSQALGLGVFVGGIKAIGWFLSGSSYEEDQYGFNGYS